MAARLEQTVILDGTFLAVSTASNDFRRRLYHWRTIYSVCVFDSVFELVGIWLLLDYALSRE